jgi:TatD DNase family protein
MNWNYFDTHSHINFSQFDEDREDILQEMLRKEIGTICVGTNIDTSRESVHLADTWENLYATVGIHPTDTAGGFDEQKFSVFMNNPKVVSVGECGLDYFRIDEEDKKTKQSQKEVFQNQIECALKHDLPLMLHGRPRARTQDAYREMLEILEDFFQNSGDRLRGNVHFFVGSIEIAKRFLEMGFTLSFDGPITFSREYDDVISFLPQDALLAETDSPYAAPDPYRGKRNSPLYIPYIVRKLAEIRKEDEEKVRVATIQNTKRIFGI